MATQLDQELRTYEKRRLELLSQAEGKFVLIKGDRLVDVYESQEDALKRGHQEFGSEPFLVKQVVEFEVPLNFASFQLGL